MKSRTTEWGPTVELNLAGTAGGTVTPRTLRSKTFVKAMKSA